MGCDIHAYIEKQPYDDGTWYLTATFRLDRDYLLFSILAGVRGNGCLYPPRGIPMIHGEEGRIGGISWSLLNEYTLCVSDSVYDPSHEISKEDDKLYYSKEEHIGYEKCRIVHPDWHTPSYLYADELVECNKRYKELSWEHSSNRELVGVINFMQALNEDNPKRTRLIFWFDN